MEMFLRKEGLWNITNAPPDDLTPAQERDNENNIVLRICIEDLYLIHVRGMESAHECWTALMQLYVCDSVVSKISLMQKLHRVRMLPGISMTNHLQYMHGIVC